MNLPSARQGRGFLRVLRRLCQPVCRRIRGVPPCRATSFSAKTNHRGTEGTEPRPTEKTKKEKIKERRRHRLAACLTFLSLSLGLLCVVFPLCPLCLCGSFPFLPLFKSRSFLYANRRRHRASWS